MPLFSTRRVSICLRTALSRRLAALLTLVYVASHPGFAAEPLPIADAHVHYSHDAWEVVPTAEVIGLMRKAGLRFALVSSSSDEGTQRLYAAAPELIVPSLRPYRTRGEIGTWLRDEAVARHIEDRLRRFRYAAVGEFHLYGADADLPVPRRLVELARQHNLILDAHSDADAIERLFAQYPEARILWAHSGFDRPASVRAMLRKHPKLWADLAFRNDHGNGGKVDPEWRAAFMEFPERFMVGTDTFTPERLHYIPEHANWSRAFLADLPAQLAERIAWRNAEALVMPVWKTNQSRPLADAVDKAGGAQNACAAPTGPMTRLESESTVLVYETTPERVVVGQRFSVLATVCPRRPSADVQTLSIDAVMPEHRHGMNYTPQITQAGARQFRVDGMMMHMPGRWQMNFDLRIDGRTERLSQDLVLR